METEIVPVDHNHHICVTVVLSVMFFCSSTRFTQLTWKVWVTLKRMRLTVKSWRQKCFLSELKAALRQRGTLSHCNLRPNANLKIYLLSTSRSMCIDRHLIVHCCSAGKLQTGDTAVLRFAECLLSESSISALQSHVIPPTIKLHTWFTWIHCRVMPGTAQKERRQDNNTPLCLWSEATTQSALQKNRNAFMMSCSKINTS